MKSSIIEKLQTYIDSHRPIIYMNHYDFNTVDLLIKEVSTDYNYTINEFINGVGYVDFDTKIKNTDYGLEEFLGLFYGDSDVFLVLKDIHNQLSNPDIVSKIKYLANRHFYNPNVNLIIFIVSSTVVIPKELEHLITLFEIESPDEEEIEDIIKNFTKNNEIDINQKTIDELSILLKGFCDFEIKQILYLIYSVSGELSLENKDFILQEKEQVVKKSGMLEIINYKEKPEDIGGLENLKEWLEKKSKIFKRLDEALKYGLDIPHGVLIVGMPGCGKSLTAKVTASMFQMLLLRLDVGRLLGKYVGESEENLRRSIKIAEATSPCVLWIDEIEKAFAGVGGSGGGNEVTTRLFGHFLTWLQEKSTPVFVVATANNIRNLPPEFLRKGRFDEIFFVDFPNDKEREKIIEIHLKKRNKLDKSINLNKLVEETKKYTGADIESVVKETIEKAFIENKKSVTTDDLIKEIRDTKPMSAAQKDKISQMRDELKNYDIKKASR